MRVGCWSHSARVEMLEATAAELESCKAEVLIKTSDLQALGAALSQAEEQFAAVSATAAEAEAAASQAIATLEVPLAGMLLLDFSRASTPCPFRLKLPISRPNLQSHPRNSRRPPPPLRLYPLQQPRLKRSFWPSLSWLLSCSSAWPTPRSSLSASRHARRAARMQRQEGKQRTARWLSFVVL